MEVIRWPSEPPAGSPFAPSRKFAGLKFTGRYASYTDADTWYPSWATDGNLYSPWTDGEVNGVSCMSLDLSLVDAHAASSPAATGQAKIVGDDPLHLEVVNLEPQAGDAAPYEGRYPCGTLVHDGVWYYGTYTLSDVSGPCGNWCTLGPFVGFRYSTDFGLSWQQTPHTPASPIFGESALAGDRVKIGSPHFVDFGQNMQHSPDGKAYLVAHGAYGPDGWANWIAGDAIFLLRVTPSIETINDPAAYEFFAGYADDGTPLWTEDFAAIKPLLDWHRQFGCVTATYNAPVGRYLMCISRPSDGFNSVGTYDTMILESASLTGPWQLVHYLRAFGAEAYFVNIPSKFIGADGRTAWLCYAANFAEKVSGPRRTVHPSTPQGSRYGMCLQEFTLEAGQAE
jgi:hypothetical protein